MDKEGRTATDEVYSPSNILTPLQVPLRNVNALKTHQRENRHLNADRPTFGFPKCLVDSIDSEQGHQERPYCSMRDERIWEFAIKSR